VKTWASALACGILFGAGLALSGMVQPEKILGFLDFAGAFDPTLAVVMAGALAVVLPAQAIARRRSAPLAAPRFAPLARLRVDRNLVGGALLFGVGWGLSGFCPGPGIAAAGAGVRDALWFLPGMTAGMLLFRGWAARTQRAVIDETGIPVGSPDTEPIS
jgi:uncharacterized membrane protein YedE/YeeE